MVKNIINILILGLFCTSLFAQNGSAYSRYGLGDLVNTNSAKKFGLGGLTAAYADNNQLNIANPATWFNLATTRFEIGLNYSASLQENNNNSAYYSDYKFSGFTFGFPIDTEYGISAAFGLAPVTNVAYEIVNDVTSASADNYTEKYSGSGGLTKVFIGGSYKTPLDFIIGVTYEYYTGNIDYKSSIDFVDFSSFRDVSFTKNYDYHGMGINSGILSGDLAKLFGWKNVKNFRIGAALNYVAKLKTDTSVTSATAVGQNTQTLNQVNTEIPYKLILGTSARIGNNYLVTFDYMFQPWTDYKVNSLKQNNLRDLQRVSVGFEYGDPTVRFATFWEQILLRCGLSYEQTQYEISGKGINEYSVFAGISFPLSFGNTLDFGFKYGLRGTTSSNLLKENLFNAFVSLSFGELWFIRQER